MQEFLFIFIVSLIANIFSAFSGGGAGLIQLPVLIFLGLPFSTALATHKIASVALGIGATLRHIKSNRLQKRMMLLMLCSGIPGVIIGANIILSIPEAIAQFSLGVITISLGVYSILKPNLGQQYNLKNQCFSGFLTGGIILFCIGILNGSLTSGTGLFATIWLIRWFGLDYQAAVAYTLVMVGLFWNGAGAITLGLIGDIYWQWLPPLLLGSFIGGYLGSHIGIKQGNQWIKRGFEVITILIGIKLVGGF